MTVVDTWSDVPFPIQEPEARRVWRLSEPGSVVTVPLIGQPVLGPESISGQPVSLPENKDSLSGKQEEGQPDLPPFKPSQAVHDLTIGHLSALVPDYQGQAVAWVMSELRKLGGTDAIMFEGASGGAIAYPVSMLTGIPVTRVLKPGETTHAYARGGDVKYLGANRPERYVIVDDLIDSGSTLDRLLSVWPSQVPQAVLLYRPMSTLSWARFDGLNIINRIRGPYDDRYYGPTLDEEIKAWQKLPRE